MSNVVNPYNDALHKERKVHHFNGQKLQSRNWVRFLFYLRQNAI